MGVGRVVPSVAHQLGTPLAAIALRAESLEHTVEGLGESDVSPKARRHLKAILEEAFRCKELLRTLQLFAQTPGPGDERIDLGDLCRGAVRLVQHEAMRRQIKVVSRLDDSRASIRGEVVRIGQAVLALLLNGVAASPKGGVVTVETLAEGVKVTVAVTDQGRGVDAPVEEQLFEPFVSTRPPHSGVGLGLMACKAVAAAHGGAVSWESLPGGGTRFALTLPREPGSGV